jgi:DNA-binding MarR family transcriptional regulator
MRSKSRRPVMPPARFVDDYLAALLAQASHLVSAEFHAVARAAGVPVAEWRILASLAGGEPLPVGRLAQIVIAPQPTVTRQLDRMVKKGLVERVAHETDRRLALVRTTAAGEALARRLVARARHHEREVLAPFGAAEAAELKAMLRTMIRLHGPAGSAALPADEPAAAATPVQRARDSTAAD